MSATGRLCCKSRKLNDPENLAKGDFQRAVTLRSAITPLRRSVVVFPRNDVVPLTSPRATRVSVPENCRSSPQKDFCNKIVHLQTFPTDQGRVRLTRGKRTIQAPVCTPALAMPAEVGNPRRIAIERVLRIALVAQRLEPHGAGIDHQQAADEISLSCSAALSRCLPRMHNRFVSLDCSPSVAKLNNEIGPTRLFAGWRNSVGPTA